MKTKARRMFAIALVNLMAGVVIGAIFGTASAHAHTTTESQNVENVQAAFDAWRAGTGSVFDLLADDGTWEVLGNTPVSGTYTGRDQLDQHVLQPFNARMSGGLTPTVRHLYADGDTVIAFFDASGTARDGEAYHNTYTWYLQMRDGQIIRAHALLDSVAFNELWNRVSA